MKFPTNISFRIQNQQEYDEFVRGLKGWPEHLQNVNEDAVEFATIVERARYHDDKGLIQDLPEAYVETGGKRIADGTFSKMYALFQQELAGHRGTVALFQLEGMTYRQVQIRRGIR